MSSVQDPGLHHAISRQAAHWYLRHRDGELDDAERREFLEWLTASPQNTREYLAYARLWGGLGEAVSRVRWDIGQLNREVQAEEGGNVVILQSARRTRRPGPGRGAGRAGLIAATVLLAAGVFYQFAPAALTGRAQVFVTQAGTPRIVTLSDGSVLRLNVASRVEVRYSGHGRDLRLVRGQAYFDVARDPGRPFRVRAGSAEVTAIGTRFDVALLDSRRTTVTVAEGLVEVQRRQLEAGEQLRVGAASPGPVSVNVREVTAWTRREVSFAGASVAEVAREFNRFLEMPIRIEDEKLNALRVGGVFDTYDAESFLNFLRQYDVRVTRRRGAIQVEPRGEQG